MGFLKKAPPRPKVEVMRSTHGQTYVMWPSDITASGAELPSLPLGHSHSQSRHWVMADKTVVICLPGDPSVYEGGVNRHTFNVVQSSWNSRKKTLTSLVQHPSDPDVSFVITTNGVGCACTQGPAGNAGPVNGPYEISVVNSNNQDFEWFTVVPS